jgi:hypothetical protein
LDEVWSESEERLELGEEMDVSAPQDNSEIEYLEDVIEWEVEMRKDYEVSSSASDDSSDSEVSASESEASSAGGVFEDSAPENDCACDKVGPSGAGPNIKGWCTSFSAPPVDGLVDQSGALRPARLFARKRKMIVDAKRCGDM